MIKAGKEINSVMCKRGASYRGKADRIVRKVFSTEVTFKLRYEGCKGDSQVETRKNRGNKV